MAKKSITCCITFDFDAMSIWLTSVGTTNPSMISRGEFGAVAIPRILDLLRKHDIISSFCIPGHTALAFPDLVRRIRDEGHEIVHHGWIHENPADFDEAGEKDILEKGLEALEKVSGVKPIGYRSPAWDLSERTPNMLRDYGFIYDSSCMGNDFSPYYLRQGDQFLPNQPYVFGKNIDLVELPVSWGLDDFPPFEFVMGITNGLSAPSAVEEIWKGDFDYAHLHPEGEVFTLTLHPQVIGRGHRIMMLDRLLTHMKNQDNVRFRSMGNFAAEWKTKNPMQNA